MLSSWDKAHKYTSTPIAIEACVHTIAHYSSDFRVPTESMSARIENPSPTETASRRAYEMAGIGSEDLDLVELQDSELEAYEKLGLCALESPIN